MSLSGPMFGPNGSTLLLNDQAVAVVISSAPAGKIAVEVGEDTVRAIEASLDVMETGRGSGKDETGAEGRERHLTAVLHHRRTWIRHLAGRGRVPHLRGAPARLRAHSVAYSVASSLCLGCKTWGAPTAQQLGVRRVLVRQSSHGSGKDGWTQASAESRERIR